MRIDQSKFFYWLGFALALSVLLACNLTGRIPVSSNQPTPLPAGVTEPAVLNSSPTANIVQPNDPTATTILQATAPPAEPTALPGPLCTVLTDLNLRPGPGTAYRPPLRALPAGTQLEPLGFNPQGVPGGPWVQVKEITRNEIGWVSAGGQFVSCNLDLTQLPAVAVAPPLPPPPEVTDSTPEGDIPEEWVWELVFSKDFLLRMKVYDSLTGTTNDGDGIAQVAFTVLDAGGNTVYQRTEMTAGYCIFGGGEPDCNPWLVEDFTYKWSQGGEAVRSGEYQVNIDVSNADGSTTGHWEVKVDLQFPQ